MRCSGYRICYARFRTPSRKDLWICKQQAHISLYIPPIRRIVPSSGFSKYRDPLTSTGSEQVAEK
jgi:hypothetical protein